MESELLSYSLFFRYTYVSLFVQSQKEAMFVHFYVLSSVLIQCTGLWQTKRGIL